MDKQDLKAQVRKEVGRKVKLLRKEGILPANVYGKKTKSEAIKVNLKEFAKVYSVAGETGLINLIIENGKKEEKAVLVSNLQHDPISDLPIHVDLREVDLTEKITAEVPVETAGESPAEKQAIGTVVQYIDEVEVEALPTDFPDKFIIDVSELTEVDQAVYAKDLKIDKNKVTILTDAETIIVKVEPPQKEEVVAPPEAEVPVEGTVAEGEVAGAQTAPVEGEAAKPVEEKPAKE